MQHREYISTADNRVYFPELDSSHNKTELIKTKNKEDGYAEFDAEQYFPLMNAKEVEQEYGIEDATLAIIISLPTQKTLVADPERVERSQIFCFRTETPEGPEYHLLTNYQLAVYKGNEFFHATLDQINDPTTPVIRQNEYFNIGRGENAWLPPAYAMADPQESRYVSSEQAQLIVDEQGLHVFDMQSYNGTQIIHSGAFDRSFHNSGALEPVELQMPAMV